MPVAEAWARRGLTLLWGAEALRDLAASEQVLPLRALFGWRGDWPTDLPSNGGRALVATGLEATLDCLAQADAETWVATDLRHLVLSFQDAYQGQCALVLWLPSGQQRVVYDAPADAWMWATADNRRLPLGRLLFSGAELDVQRILPSGWRGPPEGTGLIGLHQARLS
jgi:hypothetical protein